MRKKSILILAVMMISLLVGSVNVFAEEPEEGSNGLTQSEFMETDTAGNVLAGETSVSGQSYERDMYWFGNDMNMSNTKINYDLITAGYMLNINGVDIGGSLRSASNSLNLSGVNVGNNITAAGNTINLYENTKAEGIYACGNHITFEGECDALYAAGNTIILDGVVNGDANLEGHEVIIGSDAVVTGRLQVSAEYQPDVPDSARIGEFSYRENPNIPDEDTVKVVSAGAKFVHKLLNRAYWIPAMVIVALFFCLVIPDALNGSGKLLLARPVAMPLTGLVTMCALPAALIILCITFIGLPLAGLLALIIVPMVLFAVPFVGASVGRLVLPQMNVWLSSIIGAAVLTLVLAIPYIGGLVKFLSILYVYGYVILKCYEQLKKLGKKQEIPTAAVETPAVTQESEQ